MPSSACRGIRGATTVLNNDATEILARTKELYLAMLSENAVEMDDIAAVLFTATGDLDATFPARAVRELGHVHVPLTCTREMDVPGALPRCIRIMLLANTTRGPREIRHVYLRGAEALRPDLSKKGVDL